MVIKNNIVSLSKLGKSHTKVASCYIQIPIQSKETSTHFFHIYFSNFVLLQKDFICVPNFCNQLVLVPQVWKENVR